MNYTSNLTFTRQHGGLITYIKTTLKVTIFNGVYQQSDHWEAMFFSIDILNKSVIIGNVYRPHRELKEPLTHFTNESNRAIQHEDVKGMKIILSGDFNINLLKVDEIKIF